MKQQDSGILVTLNKKDDGSFVLIFDDVKKSADHPNKGEEVCVKLEIPITDESMDQRADYGISEDVREQGKFPVRFVLGSKLLNLVKAKKKITGF